MNRSGAKPAGFARYMQRPHKVSQILWNEFRYDGDLVLLTSDKGVREAYQTISLRAGPMDEWQSSRWKLVQVEFDYGTTVTPPTWLVKHVFVAEPDTPEDVEFLKSHGPPEPQVLDWNGEIVPLETPREVVNNVMKALRSMDEPYPLHGCEVAIRYCSPSNGASRLTPSGFAQYLKEPWYKIMTEWDELEVEDDAEPVTDDGSVVEQDVLVRRAGDASWTIVNWRLSRHSGTWLTDSLTITE